MLAAFFFFCWFLDPFWMSPLVHSVWSLTSPLPASDSDIECHSNRFSQIGKFISHRRPTTMLNIISLPLHQHHCPPPETLSQFSTVGTLSADQYIVAIISFLSVVFPLQSPCTGLVPCPLSPPLTYEMECLRICLCKFLNHLTFYCYGFLQN